MKISVFDPKSVCGSGNVDSSRLGFHTRAATLNELKQLPHGIVLFGIADETGIKNVGGRLGAIEGPKALRGKLYKFTTGAPVIPFYDLGDLEPSNTIEKTHEHATQIVQTIVENGHFPIVVGGGHDLGFPHALGTILGSGRKKFHVWNIDAHLDVRPSTEKITSGSPWYLLNEHPIFKKSKSKISEFGIQRHCNALSLVNYAEASKFGMHWLPDIRSQKVPTTKLFEKYLGPQKGKDLLLVSLDIDSVCSAEAPGCSAPQTLGFSAAEAIHMSYLAGAHHRVKSFGIFELSPLLDTADGKTAALVAHCINACCEGFATRRKVKKRA